MLLETWDSDCNSWTWFYPWEELICQQLYCSYPFPYCIASTPLFREYKIADTKQSISHRKKISKRERTKLLQRCIYNITTISAVFISGVWWDFYKLSIKVSLVTALQTTIKSMDCVLATIRSIMFCNTLQMGNMKHTAHTLHGRGVGLGDL